MLNYFNALKHIVQKRTKITKKNEQIFQFNKKEKVKN